MPFSVQLKYAKKALAQGETVAIRPDNFRYREGDCMKEWLASGRSMESYNYDFAINYIVDTDMDGTEPEVLELIEPYALLDDGSHDTDAEFLRKLYLTIPEDYNNTNRRELRETGETRITWAEFKAYIGVRA
mgnify:CR=1 FL=1